MTSPPRRAARPLPALLALLGLCAALAPALAACGAEEDAGNPESALTPEQATEPLQGASPELSAIRAEANQILDGGLDAYEQRIAALQGTPVVVNKWASWCGPCRLEFPWLQAQAHKRASEVAFLGLLSDDSEAAGSTFLSELPLPYPSYYDPDQEIAASIGAPRNFPATAFYDSSGELVYTHQGVYTDERQMAADIDRYAR